MTTSEKIYIILCVLFSASILTINMTFQKIVTLPIFYGLELSVGAMAYPITFLITDLITEFFGRERAAFCIRIAMITNIYVAMIVSTMNILPATPWSRIDDIMFTQMFGTFSLAFTGSMIACYVSQYIDVNLYLWLRKLTDGKYLWLRNNGSTIISLFIDTFLSILFTVSFGIIDKEYLYKLVVNSYIFKVLFTVTCTPLFYIAYGWIRRYIKE